MPIKDANHQITQANTQMTLDQARQVMWLRNNHRPMGELFDEGFLDRRRLEWAVEKAYDPRIKQAARLLLERHKRPTLSAVREIKQNESQLANLAFPVANSLEQARSTLWPFSPFKGQTMGTLVDTKQLSLKDLGYAIENAWDERIRHAATTLALVRLEQALKEPQPAAGILHVISGGRSYAESRQLVLSFAQGLIVGGGLIAVVIFLISDLITNPPNPARAISMIQESPYGNTLIVVVIVLSLTMLAGAVLLMFLFNKLIARMDKQIANHRKGQEGEERVVGIMTQSLDGNWYLFRNVLLPGRQRADLDGVLVGPSGVWVLETKAYSGEYRNVGDHWEYRAGRHWRKARSNPSRQARNNAIHLANFLRADGIQQWIDAVIVWANPEAPLTIENPATAVWTLDRLPDELGNLWNGEKISKDKRQQIIDKLSKLCQRQRKKQSPSKSE